MRNSIYSALCALSVRQFTWAVAGAFMLVAGSANGQANTSPVVSVPSDVSIFLGDGVFLAGSATDAENDPITTWAWGVQSKPIGSNTSFSSQFAQNTVFSADMLGDYVVSLIACDAFSCSLPDAMTISVVLDQPPTAVITTDVVSGPAPLTVNFDGSLSADPEGGALTFAWDFGDLSADSFVIAPSHTYANPGTYTATLSTRDSAGQSTQDTVLITVVAPSNAAPVAFPTADPQSGTAPLTVAFAANASDADGDVLTYAWDFGDPSNASNTATTATASHTYNQAGDYVASLTVSDGTDSVDASMTIVVNGTLAMSVKAAKIKFAKHDRTRAKLKIKANVTPGQPNATDVVSLFVDGTSVFAQPFSAFKLAVDDDEDDDNDEDGVDDDDNPGMYKLRSKHLKVEFDVVKGRIKVMRNKMDLSSLDERNGVDIELHIGAAVAVENIDMQGSHKVLKYER